MSSTNPLKRLLEEAAAAQHESTPSPIEAVAPDQLRDIPIDALHDFPPPHPFRAYTQQQLDSLRQDIMYNGIVERIIVRPLPGSTADYQIISGHNRRTAARMAGYTLLPCLVRHLGDDDTAILQMISSNLQKRENLLPSEKACAYRMQLEAMNRQLGRPYKNGDQLGHHLKSVDKLAENAEDSRNQIQRYVRLTYLIPALLDAVDNKQLAFTVAVTLSYLSEANQTAAHQFFFVDHPHPIDQRIASALRDHQGELTEDYMQQLIAPKAKPLRRVAVPMKQLHGLLPAEVSHEEAVKIIVSAVKAWYTKQQKE